MSEALGILSVFSFLLAGALGTASVVLWLRFDLHKVIGDRSKRAVKRSARRERRGSRQKARDGTERLAQDMPFSEGNMMIVHTDEVIWKGDEEEV